MQKSVVLMCGQSILVKLYNLHELAQKTNQPALCAWALAAQSSLVPILDKVPRENPITALIPIPNPNKNAPGQPT